MWRSKGEGDQDWHYSVTCNLLFQNINLKLGKTVQSVKPPDGQSRTLSGSLSVSQNFDFNLVKTHTDLHPHLLKVESLVPVSTKYLYRIETLRLLNTVEGFRFSGSELESH